MSPKILCAMTKIKFTLIVFVIFSILFISCGKKSSSSDNDAPDPIPGMGDDGGDLEADETLSIEFVSALADDITGVKVDPMPLDNPVGSGGQWVILNVLIENTTDKEANFYLPGGSVVECQTEGFQHAICISRVDILIEAEKTKQCKLLVYCINEGKPGSSPSITYRIIGVSTSDRIMQLVQALEGKKIDIRDYLPDNIVEFTEICTRIQKIVWTITNGSGPSEADWTFINSLPNVADD